MTVAAVVLAAGAGSRFVASGGTGGKALAEIGGVAMVDRVVESARGAGLDEVVVVEGAFPLSGRFAPRRSAPGRAGSPVTVVRNDRWAEGLATSLAVAVAHADTAGHDAVVVGLADQPGVTCDSWRAVAEAVSAAGLAIATYDGVRAHPVGIARAFWPELPRTGDEGARRVLRGRPGVVVEVPCTGDPHDVDTLEDLRRWT